MTAPTADVAAALAAWQTPYAETPHDLWTRTNVGEVFPRALTPLTYAVVDLLGQRLFASDPRRGRAIPPDLVRGGVLPAIFRTINGRMFYNTGLIHHLFTDRFGMPSWFWMMGLGGPQDPAGTYFEKKPFRPLQMLRGLPYILRESRRQRRVIAAFYRDRARMEAQALALSRETLEDLDIDDLVRRLDRVLVLAQPSQGQLLDGSAAAVSAFGMLAGLCGRWLGDPGFANDLVTGSGDLQTANATLALWRIAEQARALPAVRQAIREAAPIEIAGRLRSVAGGQAVAAAFEQFLRDFGHRCVDEFEISTPRWSEQADLPVATLRTYVDAGEEHNPDRALARQRRRRRAAMRTAKSTVLTGRHRFLPYRWAILKLVLNQAQTLLPLRENPKHLFLRFLAEYRRTLLQLARRLQNAGVLDDTADVFFLTRDELLALADAAAHGERPEGVRAIVAVRRRLYAAFEGWTPPEAIPADAVDALEQQVVASALEWEGGGEGSVIRGVAATMTGVVLPGEAEPVRSPLDERRLTGLAASSGVVTGRARVALTPEEGAEIEPGEILIAPFTDPGWTPLFAIAGGIVMDLGGLLSHGAIVAREYGIPAVVNTRTATAEIETGLLVTVDGKTGVVTWEGGR